MWSLITILSQLLLKYKSETCKIALTCLVIIFICTTSLDAVRRTEVAAPGAILRTGEVVRILKSLGGIHVSCLQNYLQSISGIHVSCLQNYLQSISGIHVSCLQNYLQIIGGIHVLCLQNYLTSLGGIHVSCLQIYLKSNAECSSNIPGMFLILSQTTLRSVYLVSTISEWLTAASIVTFVLTFYRDFSRIELKTPTVKIKDRTIVLKVGFAGFNIRPLHKQLVKVDHDPPGIANTSTDVTFGYQLRFLPRVTVSDRLS